MNRATRSIAYLLFVTSLSCFIASLTLLGDDFLYESAINIVPSGMPTSGSGTGIGFGTISGVVFFVDTPVHADTIGGHFYSNRPDPPNGPDNRFFGAVVALVDENPNFNLDTDILDYAVLETPGLMHAEVSGKISVDLQPGWYALVFGTDRFGLPAGASVQAVKTVDGTTAVNQGIDSTFVHGSFGQNNDVSPGIRFFISGTTDVPIVANSFTVTNGDVVSGGLPELASSDDMDLSLRRRNGDLQSRTEFEVKSTSPTATPTIFEFTLEGSVFARGNVVQTIEWFDYDAGAWEIVDTSNARRAPAPDSVVTATLAGDLSRFVEAGTLCIEARIRYKSDANRQKFASNTDQVIWTIE